MQPNSDNLNKKASKLIDKGRYKTAIKLLDKSLQLDKENDAAWFNKGLSLYLVNDKKRNYYEAIRCFNKAKLLDRNNSKIWHYLGHCYNELEKYKDAVLCFSNELKIDSSDDHSWTEKGNSLLELGIEPEEDKQLKEAILCYEKAIKLNPKNDIALANKGRSLWELKKYDEAIKSFDKALRIDRNDGFSLHYKGHCLQELGKHEEALKCLKKSKVGSDKWYRISLSYLALEKYSEATKAFRKTLRIPKDQKTKLKSNKGKDKEAKAQRLKKQLPEVFIVHGHDEKARESVKKFIKSKRLEPIILKDIPFRGKNLIDKLDGALDKAKYAIVLLTPDDSISSKIDKDVEHHARQNVILEYGLSRGKLGKENVCLLIKGNVHIPSDLQGVGRIEMNRSSEWKKQLTKELKAVKLITK